MLIWCGIGAELGQNCVCHMVLGLPSKAFVPTPLPQMVSWLSTETSDQPDCRIKLPGLTVNEAWALPLLKEPEMSGCVGAPTAAVVIVKFALRELAGTVTVAGT